MNILILTQYFWPENFRINDLATGLQERGHRVTVLTGLPNYPEGRLYPGYSYFSRYRESFGPVRVVRVPLIPRGKSKGLNLALNYLSFCLSASLLGPLLCRERYDAIFVFEISPVTVGIPAIVLGKVRKAPVFFWVLDLWPESLSASGAVKSRWILKQVARLVRFIYRRCDRILVASLAFIPQVEALGGDPQRIRYFPNWAERVFTENRAPETEILPDLPSGFRLLFAGNIGAAQDFATILGAAEKLREIPEIHWLIVGEGRERPWVEEEIRLRRLSSNVHLLGKFPLSAMPDFFSQADGMLVTLRKEPIFSLTVPAKIQSYLAAGKPIVAALEGAGEKVIRDARAGFVAPPEDPGQLAKAVLALYRLPNEEREAMGRRGKDYYEESFSRELLLARLETWFQETAGQQPDKGVKA
jgi:glycosyltransferase involved in cell wall biosynthesis